MSDINTVGDVLLFHHISPQYNTSHISTFAWTAYPVNVNVNVAIYGLLCQEASGVMIDSVVSPELMTPL